MPGLQLVRAGETADVAMVHSNGVFAAADEDAVLTPRELAVLTLLAEGTSDKAIARRLGI